GSEPADLGRGRAQDRLSRGERVDGGPVGRRDERRERGRIDAGAVEGDAIPTWGRVDRLAGGRPGPAEPGVVFRDDRHPGDTGESCDRVGEPPRKPARDPDEERRWHLRAGDRRWWRSR